MKLDVIYVRIETVHVFDHFIGSRSLTEDIVGSFAGEIEAKGIDLGHLEILGSYIIDKERSKLRMVSVGVSIVPESDMERIVNRGSCDSIKEFIKSLKGFFARLVGMSAVDEYERIICQSDNIQHSAVDSLAAEVERCGGIVK
jgi:hypothetical protein